MHLVISSLVFCTSLFFHLTEVMLLLIRERGSVGWRATFRPLERVSLSQRAFVWYLGVNCMREGEVSARSILHSSFLTAKVSQFPPMAKNRPSLTRKNLLTKCIYSVKKRKRYFSALESIFMYSPKSIFQARQTCRRGILHKVTKSNVF